MLQKTRQVCALEVRVADPDPHSFQLLTLFLLVINVCELLLGPIPVAVPALVLQPGVHPGADSAWCAHPPHTLALFPSQGHQVRYL
jgi:hypothetical protein